MSQLNTEDGQLRNTRDYLIMPAVSEDLNFIVDSWAASYAQSPAVININPEIYKVEMRAQIALILSRGRAAVARPRSHITVDGRPSHATDILGYVVYGFDGPSQTPVVFWTYTKRIVRGHGVAGELLKDAVGVTTNTVAFCPFWTPSLRRAEKRSNLVFNPFVLPQWAVHQTRK